MKKIILCFVALLLSTVAFADDIIVTRDAKKIEARIFFVSSSEVRYKEIDNLDGPTFVLETSEISSIIYRNGKVQLFDAPEANAKQETKADTDTKSEVAQVAPIQHQNTQEQQISQPHATTAATAIPNIVRIDNDYFVGDHEISQAELKNYYRKYCPQAYEQYRKGQNMCIAGGVVAGAILGATLGWTIVGVLPNSNRSLATTLGVSGALIAVDLGIALPLTICGSKKSKSAYDIYKQHQNQNYADFKVGVSENGLTLAVSF